MGFREPWVAIEAPDEQEAMARRLSIEVGRGHVLFGQAISAIARRNDADDVLFRLSDGRLAEVHLTWATSGGTSDAWPSTVLFASELAWREAQAG